MPRSHCSLFSVHCSLFSVRFETRVLSIVAMALFEYEYAHSRRRYARWFRDGRDGAVRLGAYALAHASRWEQLIDRWQRPILDDKYADTALLLLLV